MATPGHIAERDVTIRLASAADAGSLAELAATTFRDTFAADNDPDDMALHLARAYGAEQQGREIADPRIVTLVVDAKGVLVGYAQLRRAAAPTCVLGAAPIELWRFYLARPCRGRGIAQRLMHEVQRAATSAEARTLWLGVWERNERAQAFYRKCGFTEVGAHVFTLGSDPQTDRIFVRVLV